MLQPCPLLYLHMLHMRLVMNVWLKSKSPHTCLQKSLSLMALSTLYRVTICIMQMILSLTMIHASGNLHGSPCWSHQLIRMPYCWHSLVIKCLDPPQEWIGIKSHRGISWFLCRNGKTNPQRSTQWTVQSVTGPALKSRIAWFCAHAWTISSECVGNGSHWMPVARHLDRTNSLHGRVQLIPAPILWVRSQKWNRWMVNMYG